MNTLDWTGLDLALITAPAGTHSRIELTPPQGSRQTATKIQSYDMNHRSTNVSLSRNVEDGMVNRLSTVLSTENSTMTTRVFTSKKSLKSINMPSRVSFSGKRVLSMPFTMTLRLSLLRTIGVSPFSHQVWL